MYHEHVAYVSQYLVFLGAERLAELEERCKDGMSCAYGPTMRTVQDEQENNPTATVNAHAAQTRPHVRGPLVFDYDKPTIFSAIALSSQNRYNSKLPTLVALLVHSISAATC